jgi:hypothetical protein
MLILFSELLTEDAKFKVRKLKNITSFMFKLLQRDNKKTIQTLGNHLDDMKTKLQELSKRKEEENENTI